MTTLMNKSMMRGMNRHDEQGFVAIFTVLIIMALLALVTIGFSNITRQAQRRTLDDQLNTQAFYAAETGVNRARTLIDSGVLADDKTECQNDDLAGYNYTVDAALGVSITCLLADVTPPNITFDSVPVAGTGEAVTFLLENENTTGVGSVNVSWDSRFAGDPLPSSTTPDLLTLADWANRVGIIKLDLVPTSSVSRADMVNNSHTFYLYPTSAAVTFDGLVNQGPGNHGRFIMVQCNSAGEYRCVSGDITLPTNSRSYYARLQSYYNQVAFEIDGEDTSGTDINFSNGQAEIDSTGNVGDVYRRIQVRVPIIPDASYTTGFHTIFSLFGGDSICKRIVALPGGSQVLPPPAPDTSDTACAVN